MTHDNKLTFVLRRVPIKGFKVMGLRELLDRSNKSTTAARSFGLVVVKIGGQIQIN
jgi:hypothetical protein